MNKLWRFLFVVTWIVVIFTLVFMSIVLLGREGQTQHQTINQYVTRGNGADAYQVALKNGFMGTESEWLASLKGSDSLSTHTVVEEKTVVVEQVPIQGERGKNNYELWLDLGNNGSLIDYQNTLKGVDGKTVTTLIRLNETTGKIETKLSTDSFWKVIPSCGGTSGRNCS